MKKHILLIVFAIFVVMGALAQQKVEKTVYQDEQVVPLRGCRMGKHNPQSMRYRSRVTQTTVNPYIGNRRQLVVMASYKDRDFAEDHSTVYQKWDKIFNEENYSEGDFYGSVHDYFMTQSYGKFNLKFDLIFVELPDSCKKYRSTRTHDEYSQYMVDDIVDALQTEDIDWSLYDWDGDSFVDQLLIIFAGKGMDAGGGTNSIWPHQWWLSEHMNFATEDPIDKRGYRAVTYNNKEYYVDCYCCAQELLDDGGRKTSFANICHEFTHCFGFPDFYYGRNDVLGSWDLMATGNFNGQGFYPCNYSAHERMLMGWLTPVELSSSVDIVDMPSLDDEPVAYLIRNDGAENEYYIVENRRQQGWDKYLPGSGIVIFHIDYDKNLWEGVTDYVNKPEKKRYCIIPANNDTLMNVASKWPYPYVVKDIQGNDSIANNCLTNTSEPQAKLNNPNVDGSKLMSKPITNMAIDANGYASFSFMSEEATAISNTLIRYDSLQHNAHIYDLQGRKISAPIKGLYIQGGKVRMKY